MVSPFLLPEHSCSATTQYRNSIRSFYTRTVESPAVAFGARPSGDGGLRRRGLIDCFAQCIGQAADIQVKVHLAFHQPAAIHARLNCVLGPQ